ncbi:MAG: rhomboid family intramembrane serine protease [Chlorobi bacterium]|nr:rhomboid family intramembrane serine protease [Chlorobiota bacterium]
MSLNLILIVVTVIVSVVAFGNPDLFARMRFNAYLIKNNRQTWRFISYALIHAGWLHLIINMWVLYLFGKLVEAGYVGVFGVRGYLFYFLLYLGGVIFSVLYDFGKHKNDPNYNAVGASGAVSAVLFSSILFYPTGGIYVFPIPFSIPAWLFGILYLVYSAYMGKRGQDNVGHDAHFFGALFGIVFTAIIVPNILTHFIEQLFG